MASFRKQGTSWQARVRRRGYPVEIKSFPTKAEAERWARAIEGEMDRGEFVSRTEAEQTTFGGVIQRYMESITPKKRGHVDETIRLKATLRHRIARMSMANLTPQAVADYRDDRLRTCKANTVIRDLAAMSSIINHARREWGIVIQNPVEMIRKPTMPPGRDRVLSEADEIRLLRELAPTGRRNPIMQPLVVVGHRNGHASWRTSQPQMESCAPRSAGHLPSHHKERPASLCAAIQSCCRNYREAA